MTTTRLCDELFPRFVKLDENTRFSISVLFINNHLIATHAQICHSRSGEINPHKIKNLIDAYVRKFRAKHKKLNLLNTGQVSSAVKCAAYLKKL